jgi:hypothetical protein
LVVEMKGNGTFRGMMVSVKNQSSETKAIRFPAGLVFARPAKEKVADMLLVKDETFELDPGASDIRLIEAYSLSYVKGAPGTETSYAASDLRMGSDPKLLDSSHGWVRRGQGPRTPRLLTPIGTATHPVSPVVR